MSLGCKRAGLFVQTAHVFKPGLPPDRIDEVHASAARQHENPLDSGIMQKAHHVIGKLDQEGTAKSVSSFRSVVTVCSLLFHGCG